MVYLLDTSAWIEYFTGTQAGVRVRELIKDETVITPESVVSEMYSWALKKNKDFSLALELIRRRSIIYSISLNLWIEAAHIRGELRKRQPKIGLMDALVIASQRATNTTIITKDNDFIGLPDVIIL